MGLSRADLLKKIASSSASGGGNYLQDGRGRVALKKFSLDNGYKGARCVVDFVVVSSQKIPVQDLESKKTLDIEPNPPHSSFSQVFMFDKTEAAFGAVKRLVLALYNIGEDEVDQEELIQAIDELDKTNCAQGKLLDYETYRTLTGNKIQIVLPRWTHVPQDEANIAQVKAWLNSLVQTEVAPAAQATA